MNITPVSYTHLDVYKRQVIIQLTIFYIYYLDIVSFLWLNFIGAMLTIVLSLLGQFLFKEKETIEITA